MNENLLDFSSFEQVEIRVGRVVAVEDFAEARIPAYKMVIDFGPLGRKKSSAQITDFYQKEELLGRQVLAVYNLKPKQVGKYISEVLILGVVLDNDQVVLVGPDRETPSGLRIL
jgi:tRNA-binding protein